ncbi:Retrovirus-related Pol polyprotein from transposon RE1 [Vitis vinifera]|uniref:Retrovirus-related Pol polyprotein from transposon RE1 n=1 Tax=Vitis vinifera TaxID=29760 RepID=A0A438H8I6_VITVI|nr:Retrovirus-related Pol polyprotein from transposon RE1 [Vitis vinifera]
MTTKNQIFTSVISGSPMITSEKLVGSENYLSWSASVELWFMGQGYEDHLVTQEADIPEVDRVQWRKIDAQPNDYTRMISSVFIKVASAIVHLSQQDLDLSTYILDKFFMVLLLLASVRILSLFMIRFLVVSSVPSLDDVFARLLCISSTQTLPSDSASDSSVLVSQTTSREDAVLHGRPPRTAHMAQSSDSPLPQPPSSSASQTSQASIASVAQPGNASACLTHTSSLGPWILDSGASDHLSGNKDLFSSITTTSDLPTVTLANGSQTVAKGPEYGEDDWHRTLSKFQKMVPRFSTLSSLPCESCQLGKHTRVSFPKRLNNRAKSPFELVHTDVWGPCRTASTLGFQYFVTFIDDYSRLTMPGNIFQPIYFRLCLIMGFFISLLVLILLNKMGFLTPFFPDQPLYFLPPRVFGCTCFVHILTPGQDKLSAKAMKCLFLGYSRLQKGYRCYSLETHRYFISADVTFFEDSPFFSTTSESLPVSEVLPIPIVSPPDAMPLDHFRFIIVALVSLLLSLFLRHLLTHFLSLRLHLPRLCLLLMTYPLLFGKSTHEALSHPGWRQAMVDEMAALHSNGTWDLVVLPSGKSTVGCRWVYAVKVGPDGQIASVRLLLSMAAMCSWPLYQLDIKNAFLHGDLAEEVYMEQPPGFVAQGESGLVCRLRRSLYGLKQSPRAWFSRFSSVVQEFGMLRSTADHSVFYHHNSLGQCIYLVVYVDDIVITGSDQDGIQKLKQHLFTHFQTKDLGKLKYFLGIEIAQSSSGVVLSQRKYALDILEETGMLDCKPVDTPMDPNVKLVPGQGEPLGDPGRYRRLVGKLNYLTITRPDISFPVSVVSQFLQSPCDSHWDAVIRILRYIKSTPGQGVLYENRGHTQVVGYTDADWAGSPTDRRSTSGYCVFIGGNLISWKSKKQDVVARSSAEAEYRAMALATCELIWLRHLLQELRFGKDEQMKLICDNQAALHIASNPVFHERTKHIEVDCHFIREKIASGCVATSFVNSNDQLADIFTKSLRGPRIKYICNKLGAYDVYAPA